MPELLSGRLHGLRVLVVDDCADAADSLAMVLRLAGAEVRVAYRAAPALELARDFRPLAAILDLAMPNHDGYDLARGLCAQANGEPPLLIAVTGYARGEDRQRSKAEGFAHHLAKPIDPAQLVVILGELARARLVEAKPMAGAERRARRRPCGAGLETLARKADRQLRAALVQAVRQNVSRAARLRRAGLRTHAVSCRLVAVAAHLCLESTRLMARQS